MFLFCDKGLCGPATENPFFLHINADRPELLLYLNFTYTNKKSGATEKRPVDEDNSTYTVCAVQGLHFGLDTAASPSLSIPTVSIWEVSKESMADTDHKIPSSGRSTQTQSMQK